MAILAIAVGVVDCWLILCGTWRMKLDYQLIALRLKEISYGSIDSNRMHGIILDQDYGKE
jgi:hypothetical protein